MKTPKGKQAETSGAPLYFTRIGDDNVVKDNQLKEDSQKELSTKGTDRDSETTSVCDEEEKERESLQVQKILTL